jgi:hypothetical protein
VDIPRFYVGMHIIVRRIKPNSEGEVMNVNEVIRLLVNKMTAGYQ